MRFDVAIDEFVADMRSQGRMNSDKTERDYRLVLYAHAEDIDNATRATRIARTSRGLSAAGPIRTRNVRTAPS